jgi:hypothetical protein
MEKQLAARGIKKARTACLCARGTPLRHAT